MKLIEKKSLFLAFANKMRWSELSDESGIYLKDQKRLNTYVMSLSLNQRVFTQYCGN